MDYPSDLRTTSAEQCHDNPCNQAGEKKTRLRDLWKNLERLWKSQNPSSGWSFTFLASLNEGSGSLDHRFLFHSIPFHVGAFLGNMEYKQLRPTHCIQSATGNTAGEPAENTAGKQVEMKMKKRFIRNGKVQISHLEMHSMVKCQISWSIWVSYNIHNAIWNLHKHTVTV